MQASTPRIGRGEAVRQDRLGRGAAETHGGAAALDEWAVETLSHLADTITEPHWWRRSEPRWWRRSERFISEGAAWRWVDDHEALMLHMFGPHETTQAEGMRTLTFPDLGSLVYRYRVIAGGAA